MSGTASTLAIIAAVVGIGGVQTFWIGRSIEALTERVAGLEQRLDDMFRVLLEHGERIARLEERACSRERRDCGDRQ